MTQAIVSIALGTDAQVTYTVSLETAIKIISLASTGIAPASAPVQTPVTQAPASAPSAPAKPSRPADIKDVEVAYSRKDNCVAVTAPDGSYIASKAVRQVVNARLKAAGFEWDGESDAFGVCKKGERAGKGKGAWVLMKGTKRDIKGAEDFVLKANTTVTADELKAVYDRWDARKARKNR